MTIIPPLPARGGTGAFSSSLRMSLLNSVAKAMTVIFLMVDSLSLSLSLSLSKKKKHRRCCFRRFWGFDVLLGARCCVLFFYIVFVLEILVLFLLKMLYRSNW